MTIKGRADRRSEDKVVILPERSCVQPVGRLLFAMLAESPDSQVGQQQDAPTLPGLGVARGPDSAVDRDGTGVEVNLKATENVASFGIGV